MRILETSRHYCICRLTDAPMQYASEHRWRDGCERNVALVSAKTILPRGGVAVGIEDIVWNLLRISLLHVLRISRNRTMFSTH
jgi:hypothetical protein